MSYKAFFILLTIFCTHLKAIVPEIEIWSNGSQYLYLLKDIHLDNVDAATTIQQHKDIIWVLQQKKSDIYLIVEDVSTEGIPGHILLEDDLQQTLTLNHPYRTLWHNIINKLFYKKSPRTPCSLFYDQLQRFKSIPSCLIQGHNKQLLNCTPLSYLAYFCQRNRIQHYNTECCAKLIHYLHANGLNSEQEAIAQQTIVKIFSNRLQELAHNSSLYSFYNDIHTKIEKLKTLGNPCQKDTFILEAFTIRCNLLESLTIKEILDHQYIEHMIIYQGALHIEKYTSILPTLNYKLVKTVGLPLTSLLNLKELMLEPTTIESLLCPTIPAKYRGIIERCVDNSLDLHKTFTDIFNEQKPLWQKAVTYLISVWMKIR